MMVNDRGVFLEAVLKCLPNFRGSFDLGGGSHVSEDKDENGRKRR